MLGRLGNLYQHLLPCDGPGVQPGDIGGQAARVRRPVQGGLIDLGHEVRVRQTAVHRLAFGGRQEGGGDLQQRGAARHGTAPGHQPGFIRQAVEHGVEQPGQAFRRRVPDPEARRQGRPGQRPVLRRFGEDEHQLRTGIARTEIDQPVVDLGIGRGPVQGVGVEALDILRVRQGAEAGDELVRGQEPLRHDQGGNPGLKGVELDMEAECIRRAVEGSRVEPHQLRRLAVGIEGHQPVDEGRGLDARQRVGSALAAADHGRRVDRAIVLARAGIARHVIAVAAVDRVIAAAAGEDVIARTAVQRVRAAAAEQGVVAAVAVQGGAGQGHRHRRCARDRDMEGIGSPRRRRAGDQGGPAA